MSALPTPTIRLRLDPTNPGQFFACCGVLELCDRAWGGAEGWFEKRADFFCIAPLDQDPSRDCSGKGLLHTLRLAPLTNARMTDAQMSRLEELDAVSKKKRKPSEDAAESAQREVAEREERAGLEALWTGAKDGALHLGTPFGLRLDWYLDRRGSRFKTWAGQQNISQLAFDLKGAITSPVLDDRERDWLFQPLPCGSSLHLDAVSAGSDIDVGFSFDPLRIGSPEKRGLVELCAFVAMQRFRPQQVGRENLYVYSAWLDPLVPELARAAAADALGAPDALSFEFRLLYRTKYLKSFLSAQPRGDHA